MVQSLLTAQEVADMLGVSERYVWKLGREGRLPRVKPPGSKYVRFKLEDVQAYIDAGTQEAPTPKPRATSKRRRFA